MRSLSFAAGRPAVSLFLYFLFITILLALNAPALSAAPADYQRLKAEAEKFYRQGSFAKAHKLYAQTNALELDLKERRWVDFRIADTLWREQAATKQADASAFDRARRQLDFLIRDITREEEKDRVWAEVHESLGDFWWLRSRSKNWGQGWTHYQKALDWWAGAKDIELARTRYLGMVWNIASPHWREPYYYYGYYGNMLPVAIVENALKISKSEQDRVRAQYLLAMTLKQRGGWEQRERVPEAFEAVIAAGKTFEWYDDALFQYAEWLNNQGNVVVLENGGQRQERDHVKALKLYRRLVREFKKGETRHFDAAQRRIETITKPVLNLSVGHVFVPDSEIEVRLHWRNVERAGLALYAVDLTRDVNFEKDKGAHDWIHQINLRLKKKFTSWSEDTEDDGKHKPGQKTIAFKKKLPPGAYILEATGGGARARDLILVTEAALVLKTTGKQALVYFCDAMSGAPIANARVALWERHYTGRKWVWSDRTAQTDADGLARFELKDSRHSEELFAAALESDRQAFGIGHNRRYHLDRAQWKLYAFTDRPAYRPGETAEWKLTARTYDGSLYSTPSGSTVEYKITDPKGAKVAEGALKLNDFGSAWSELALTETMPLGTYRVSFWIEGRKKHIGDASLFALEEYKLPEFSVRVATPEEDDKKKSFQLGDKVTVDIDAEYYFGGPVANANVEVFLYQRPFYPAWRPERPYPWYYEDRTPRHWGGRGQQMQRQVLKTDPEGRARFSFDTKRSGQDLEYTIEARVTDASRREIVGRGSVRVTKQKYYVYLNPKHRIYRPQDRLDTEIKSLDANDQPVQAAGEIRVTRDFWFEIWIDPQGREVQGAALEAARKASIVFPPPPPVPGGPSWRLKFRGYQHDEILKQRVATNAEGEALFTFTPEREGYYRIAFTSEEKHRVPIKAETTVWVATGDTAHLGMRPGGLQIIVDKDTFQAGQTAPVMLVAPASGRHVLFSVEGDDLLSHRLVHLTGSVKLIELAIGEKHVPNIFLNAVMVNDRQIYQDTKQVVVPPVKNFLNVSVAADREGYEPREEGTYTVTTTDHAGKPVSAEVALGVADASVYTIQEEMAPDPRQFFFGRKRIQRPQTVSTFNFRRYMKLVEDGEGRLIDARLQTGDKEEARSNIVGQRSGSAGSYRQDGKSIQGLSARAPAPAAKSRSEAFADDSMVAEEAAAFEMEADAGGGGEAAVTVRSDFRSTAFWQPDLRTDAHGKARVKVKFPDSLTQWKATARAVTQGNRFGIATGETRTRKPLTVRLQAPRFFVVGDSLTLSALINNNTEQAMTVRPALDVEGISVSARMQNGKKVGRGDPLKIAANGETRVDWFVSAQRPGEARIRVTAAGKTHADAMEKSYPVHEHGVEKLIARSGKMSGSDLTVGFDIPKERKAKSTELTLQVAPSIAVTMLDALPYLIDYPYGCTEQTMSRFLPAVITAKTLADLGLQREAVGERIFRGGIDPETAAKTHPKGRKNMKELDAMIEKGLDRLYDFQHADGGWGWWKKGESDGFMSAYVLWGLTLAQGAGVEVESGVRSRAAKFLDTQLVEAENRLDLQAFMLHALASRHAAVKAKKRGKLQAQAFANLWSKRTQLNAYARALLALSAHHYGEKKKALILIENLENGVVLDQTPDSSAIQRGKKKVQPWILKTAHWGEDGIFRRWSEGGVEATAFALSALITIDPGNPLVEPVMNWLVKNRRGSHWSNTRDTAMVVLALNDYLRASGELSGRMEYELWVNGTSLGKTRVEDVLSAPTAYRIDRKLVEDGTNQVRLVRHKGEGPLYFSIQAKFFSLEEPVLAAGNEIFLRRDYYQLVGRPTLLKGYVFEKIPLKAGDAVRSGTRIETVVTIETKNNYEYLIVEDLKPAGFEAVRLRSGQSLYARELKSSAVDRKMKPAPASFDASTIAPVPGGDSQDHTGRTRWVHQELRDRKTALFIDKLPQGVWEIRYELRAEVPGEFHALPVLGHAMYIPEIRANGEETRVSILERRDAPEN